MKTIFISLDTVHAGRLSALGPSKVATPYLEEFASRSAVFTSAFATDIPTQPSHTAVFTGRCGAATGIVSHFHPPAMLSESAAWLPSLYHRAGARTGAVDHLFSMKEWFIRGYDDYLVPPGRSRSPGRVINDLGFEWLDRHHGEDFFLFLHFWDAHIPYVPPEPFRSNYLAQVDCRPDSDIDQKLRGRPSYKLFKQNLYDHIGEIPNLEVIEALHHAEIAYLDYELGRLFEKLDRLGILDECTIVLFGDHGEIMTEHDAWFDHAGLYDSVVHVPLIIRSPGISPSRIDAMVSLVDVMPTLVELDGLSTGSGMDSIDGRSLTGLMSGSETEHRNQVYLSECTWQAKRGIRTRQWKYIRCWDPGIYPRLGPELYDLDSDPTEQHNVAEDRYEVVEHFDAMLESWMAGHFDRLEDPFHEVLEHGLPAVTRLKTLG